MSDPLSLIALGAAIGGAAGKFTEKAWDSGARWLGTYFADHQPKAQQAAQENAAAFLIDLAQRVRRLEEEAAVPRKQISEAQDHPQFSVVLQHALITAAQTSNETKRSLLSTIVARRLAAPEDATISFATRLACDALAHLTGKQLDSLALAVAINEVRTKVHVEPPVFQEWLESLLWPFEDLEFEEIDAMHLCALGCITYDPKSERSLTAALAMKNNLQFDEELFLESSVGTILQIRWDMGFAGIRLTSVGSLIGGVVLGQRLGHEISQPGWAK